MGLTTTGLTNLLPNTVAYAGLSLQVEGSSPVQAAEPDAEYVAGFGPRTEIEELGFESYSQFHRRQPLMVLRAMMKTPPIQSALWSWKSTVLSGGFQFAPALDPEDDGIEDPDAALAETILEQCKRAAGRLETPLELWAWEMLDAFCERVKLSEVVMEPVADGPDAGLYSLKALKVKPRWAWRFRVDVALDVVAIECWTVDAKWEALDPAHFAWLAWNCRDGDPRGDSALDAAFHAFNILLQLWPVAQQGWKQFGFPNVLLTTGANDRRDVPVLDKNGTPTGKTVSAQTNMARAGAAMRAGAVIAGTYGSDGKVLESTRDGSMVTNAIELLEAQMIVCLILQTRSIREAQFGSKADATNGSDVAGSFAQPVRQWLCAMVQRPFRAMVEANYGPAIAARLTPKVTLGKIDPRNFAAIAQALAVLYQSGYFTEKQLLWLDEFMGVPIRRKGDERVGPQKDNAAAMPPGDAPPPKADPATAAMLGEIKAMLQERGMPDV